MIDFLTQYGLFLAKTLTLIVGILVTIAGIIALTQKGKSNEGILVITHLNEKFDEIRHTLQAETLTKNFFKKWLKQQKVEEKLNKKEEKKDPNASRLFVTYFDGDIRASQVHGLRETISAILEVASPEDEVLVVLESAGGFVHSYGLAASQLHRLKERKLFVTVAIDKVAASGGYLMACVANKILAAPFAIVGSIGVVAQLPNFHRLLDKHDIDYEVHTAGEYKRTLTLFGKNTDKAKKKFQEEIEETHDLFKQFIVDNRPQVNIDHVSTGEHWYGTKAYDLKLVDKIQTSDDFILAKLKTTQVFEIGYEEKQKLSEKITRNILATTEKFLLKLLAKNQPSLMQ